MLSSASTREARGASVSRFCAMAASVRSFHVITGLPSGWVMKLRDTGEVADKVAAFIIRRPAPIGYVDSVGGEGLPSRAAPSAGAEGRYDGLPPQLETVGPAPATRIVCNRMGGQSSKAGWGSGTAIPLRSKGAFPPHRDPP